MKQIRLGLLIATSLVSAHAMATNEVCLINKTKNSTIQMNTNKGDFTVPAGTMNNNSCARISYAPGMTSNYTVEAAVNMNITAGSTEHPNVFTDIDFVDPVVSTAWFVMNGEQWDANVPFCKAGLCILHTTEVTGDLYYLVISDQ